MGRGGWVIYLDATHLTASIHGHFVLCPVLLAKEIKMAARRMTIEIYDLTVCEQSTEEKLWDNYDIQHTAGLSNSSQRHNIKYK